MHCAVLQVPDGTDRDALLATLSHDKRVSSRSPCRPSSPGPMLQRSLCGLQRGFQQMDVAEAHAWSQGEGVKVAIIDTGADTEHPDLRGSIAAAENFVDSDERPVSA